MHTTATVSRSASSTALIHERSRFSDPEELYRRLTSAECEQITERFIEVMFRHRHTMRNRLSGEQAAVELHRIYLDAQQWVRGRP